MKHTPQMLNIGCGPHRADEPWINIDVVRVPGHIEPDVIAPTLNPRSILDRLAVPDEMVLTGAVASHVYLGHVLEHVPWDDVESFLHEVMFLLEPGGLVAVVGPDVYRTLDRWNAGMEPWHIVEAVLEGGHSYQAAGEWKGARHCWNAHEARVMEALEHAGFELVTPELLEIMQMQGWPITSCAAWQCGVIARKP